MSAGEKLNNLPLGSIIEMIQGGKRYIIVANSQECFFKRGLLNSDYQVEMFVHVCIVARPWNVEFIVVN